MKFGIGPGYWGFEEPTDYVAMSKKIAGIGFDMMEVAAPDIHDMSDEKLAELKKLGEELGLTYVVNCGPSKEYDLASPDKAVRDNGVKWFIELMENMYKLGSKTIAGAIYSFWPSDFKYVDKKAAWEDSIESLKAIAPTAEKYDIECALEVLNRNETYILTTCEEAKEYCDRIGSKNINILLDTYHMNIEEDNMYDALRNAGDMLGHVHVGECNRKLPGMNNSIDWPEIGRALRDIGYDKGVVMEPFLLDYAPISYWVRVWRDLSDNATEADLDEMVKKSLVFLKSCCEGVSHE